MIPPVLVTPNGWILTDPSAHTIQHYIPHSQADLWVVILQLAIAPIITHIYNIVCIVCGSKIWQFIPNSLNSAKLSTTNNSDLKVALLSRS